MVVLDFIFIIILFWCIGINVESIAKGNIVSGVFGLLIGSSAIILNIISIVKALTK